MTHFYFAFLKHPKGNLLGTLLRGVGLRNNHSRCRGNQYKAIEHRIKRCLCGILSIKNGIQSFPSALRRRL